MKQKIRLSLICLKKMNKYRTLFIDLDDTLFDFSGASREAFRETYELLGYERFFESFEHWLSIYEPRNKELWREYNAGRISDAGEVYGPLSSLINVDKMYITAIDTALGGSLQNIVVEDVPTAKACMASLKRASAGRVTLYPLPPMTNGFA